LAVSQPKVRTDCRDDHALYVVASFEEPGDGSVTERKDKLIGFEPIRPLTRRSKPILCRSLIDLELAPPGKVVGVIEQPTDPKIVKVAPLSSKVLQLGLDVFGDTVGDGRAR
jgi:hypothetical protein